VEKYSTAGQEPDDNMIRSMGIVFWITRGKTYTKICYKFSYFTANIVARTRLNPTFNVHTLQSFYLIFTNSVHTAEKTVWLH